MALAEFALDVTTGINSKDISAARNAIEGVSDAAKGGTYVLRNGEGVVMRTGRTNDLDRRRGEHDKELPELTFEVDRRTDDYDAQRGREQILYDENPSAKKESGGLNKIQPISPRNKEKKERYLRAGRTLK